jgi:cell division protein FtsL
MPNYKTKINIKYTAEKIIEKQKKSKEYKRLINYLDNIERILKNPAPFKGMGLILD